jgi:hypothetical protein
VVDVELVEVRDPAYPSNPEEARRRSRSDRRNEPGAVPQRERSSSSFSKEAPGTREDQPGAGEVVVLAKDEVRGEITGGPRPKESRGLGTEPVEQVAELCSLHGSKSISAISREF